MASPRSWSLLRVRIVLGMLLVSTTAAHLAIQLSGQERSALVVVLDHLFELILATAIVCLTIGIGNALFRACRHEFDQPLDRLLFSFAVGSGLLATAILLCGLAGGLQLPILIGLLILVAFLSRRGLREAPALVHDSISFVRANAHPVALTLFVVMVALLLAQALLPVTDWDSLMYHVRVPAQFLQQGRIYLPEDNSHSLLVRLVHMLYLLPLALKSAAGPALLSVMFAVGGGLAMFACALRFFNRTVASGCLVTLWGSTALFLVAVTPRIDGTVAFYVFLAQYALLEALVAATSRMFFLAAVLLGFAVGAKVTAIIYGLALSPLIVWASWRYDRTVPMALRRIMLFALLGLSIAAPFLFMTWLLFGAPFYPYFSDYQVERWITVLFAGQMPYAELERVLQRLGNQLHASFSWSIVFVGQGASLMEWGGPYYVSPLLGLLPLWVICRRHKQVGWLIVPALVYTLVALPNAPVPTLRYMVPALPALTVAATYFAHSLCTRLFTALRAGIAFGALAGLALLPASVPLEQWVTAPTTIAYLTGRVSSEDYLKAQSLGGIVPAVSREIPSGSRVLMLFEARGYYFDVPVLQDNSLMNWWFLLRTDLPHQCLKSSGISHVLLNTAALEHYQRSGIDSEILRIDALNAFASRCLESFLQGPGYVVFQVKQ